MATCLNRELDKMKSKLISISDKRQITIPKEYYDKLGLGKKAKCFYDEKSGAILICPISDNDDLSEFILADLISEGYTGQSLYDEFVRRKNGIRPAVERLIAEVDEAARNYKVDGDEQLRDIFGDVMED
jgi:bifunctional DNA-binding transcriptional regulator/antitoxin component of YhaV-PrlF toxin-antitoxin module